MQKRALISVWDKTGLDDLARFLNDNGIEIVSTGGTRKYIENLGISVTPISAITGMDAVMDGRVKTLHPRIFGGILADRQNDSHLSDLELIGGNQIDIVVVNFYPFVNEAVKKNLELKKAIEFIDIGGPSMIRAAAKNYHSIVPLCSQSFYKPFMELYESSGGEIPMANRLKWASSVFKLTADYEQSIASYLSNDNSDNEEEIQLNLSINQQLRYGENPHQSAGFFLNQGDDLNWHQLQGKELSYNNFADMDSAFGIIQEFRDTACVIIKHANPCGFGFGDQPLSAYKRAVSTDPVSYFGGIVGFNVTVDEAAAIELTKSFLECIIAPDFSPEALAVFKKKKNLRIVKAAIGEQKQAKTIRSVAGGFLVQDSDLMDESIFSSEIVTNFQPSSEQLTAMDLGWKLVRFVKSNAIVLADKSQLLGVGAGQMSRIDSLKIAVRKAGEAGLNLSGAILASDAFFPFPDNVELAAEHGIKAIVQPGGSIKDDLVIQKADELGIAMVFTGKRHFFH